MSFEKIRMYLEQEIERRHIPGAVLHVSHRGKTIFQEALGYRTVFPQQSPMELTTIFDLASLTKVVATLPAVLKLTEEGKISIHDTVSKFLPGFGVNQKDEVRIRHLLTHTSGIVADRPYHKQNVSKQQILESICTEELAHPPGQEVVYSDVGMILLYFLIEQIVDEPFELYVTREIFEPLEMSETMFNPTFAPERYAGTEFCQQRQAYKLGVVHDEKAEVMGGISGHAGLFSTVQDLANFAKMIEQGGLYKHRRILSEASLQLARKNFTSLLSEGRGLGWSIKSPFSYSSCGELFSDQSYGHTGYTGTSLWFDPYEELHVIFLTNRVHFGRENHILDIRPKLHNMIRAIL